jgi:topoisomerase-4 subunit A
MDASKKKQNWLSDNPASQLLLLTDTPYPRIKVTYGGADAFRGSEEIDAEQFIAMKGFKAKGKRLTTYTLESLEELDPQLDPRNTSNTSNTSPASTSSLSADSAEPLEEENLDPDAGKSEEQVRDEITGQLNLFDNEDFK